MIPLLFLLEYFAHIIMVLSSALLLVVELSLFIFLSSKFIPLLIYKFTIFFHLLLLVLLLFFFLIIDQTSETMI